MKFASRSSLPLSLSSTRGSQVVCLARPAGVARARSRAAVAVAAPTPGGVAAGKSFGRKRIEHAVEVAGACIMLAVFLMLALLV